MKKKILALLLAVLTVVTPILMTSCNEEATGPVTEEVERQPMTLSFWIPTDESTTAEAIEQVEAAINKLTVAKYQTAIEFHAIPSDEYEAKLEEHMAKVGEAANDKKNQNEDPGTYEISNGVTSVLYPNVKSTQMDIFLVRGYENYVKYADAEEMVALDSDINGESRLLKEFVYPTFLNYVKHDGLSYSSKGSVYAIPNNHMLDNYKFLLVNKDVAADLNYNLLDLRTLNRCKDFIIDVANHPDYQHITPILSPVEASPGVVYLNEDGSKSVFCYLEMEGCDNSTNASFLSVFDVTDYRDNVYNMKLYAENGYFAEDPDNCEDFAVGVIEGGYDVYEKYGDKYDIKIFERPIARNEDVFEAMFAVSQYTIDTSRAMEIITMLNTDPELRTVLQYGAQGIHWDYADDEETTIKKLADGYKMNLVETGNVYMTYPDFGETKEVWELAKKANLDSSTSPLLCVTGYYNETSKPHFDAIATISEDIFARVEDMTSDEFKKNISAIRKEITGHESYKWLTTWNDETITQSIGYIYYEYYNTVYPELAKDVYAQS